MAIALGDLVSSVGGVFGFGVDDESADPNPVSMNAAAEAYGLTGFVKDGGKQSFNLPKLQYSYLIQFTMTETAANFLSTKYPGVTSRSMSYLVKDADLPSQTYDIYTVNQYNRTRQYSGKVQYNPINIAVYDTIDSGALKIYDAYRSWYNADFHNKRFDNWTYNQVSNTANFEDDLDEFLFDDETYQDIARFAWGRSVLNQGDLNENYFFKRIDIIEIQDGIFTFHNIHNPIIQAASFETKSHESDGEPALINFTFNYEGTSNINPLLDSRYDPIAISRPASELDNLLSASQLGADRHFKHSKDDTGLPLDDLEGEDGGFGALVDTVIDTAQGATEALGIPGADEAFENIGNISDAGITASDDVSDSVSNDALDSIGGLL